MGTRGERPERRLTAARTEAGRTLEPGTDAAVTADDRGVEMFVAPVAANSPAIHVGTVARNANGATGPRSAIVWSASVPVELGRAFDRLGLRSAWDYLLDPYDAKPAGNAELAAFISYGDGTASGLADALDELSLNPSPVTGDPLNGEHASSWVVVELPRRGTTRGWTVAARMARRADRVDPVELRLFPSMPRGDYGAEPPICPTCQQFAPVWENAPAGGVNSDLLRAVKVPALQATWRRLFERIAPEVFSYSAAKWRRATDGRHDDAFYAQVAAEVAEAAQTSSRFISEVAKRRKVDRRKVEKWVGVARNRGFLTAPGQGSRRSPGSLTDRGREVLEEGN